MVEGHDVRVAPNRADADRADRARGHDAGLVDRLNLAAHAAEQEPEERQEQQEAQQGEAAWPELPAVKGCGYLFHIRSRALADVVVRGCGGEIPVATSDKSPASAR